MMPDSTDIDKALDVARDLIRHGIPVFVAKRASTPTGETDWNGEHVSEKDRNRFLAGYLLPRWTRVGADERELDRYEPGDALGMVCGYGMDVVDVDPRNGGAESFVGLCESGLMPTAFGIASTPSGGEHHFIRSLGVRSLDNAFPGIDVKAGTGGRGHGFVFIAPTVKLSKETGEPVPYTWDAEPDMDALTDTLDADDGEALAAVLNEKRGPARDIARTVDVDAKEYGEYDEDARRRIDAYVESTLAGMESDLLAAHSWPEPGDGVEKTGHNSWERLTMSVFYRAANMAAAEWNAATLDAVGRRLLAAAPRFDGVTEKWKKKAHYAIPAPLPFDPAEDRLPDTTLTDVDGNPVVDAVAKSTGDAEIERRVLAENRWGDNYLAEAIEPTFATRFMYVEGLGWHRYDGRRWLKVEESKPLSDLCSALRKLHTRELVAATKKYAEDTEKLDKIRRALNPLKSTKKARDVLAAMKGNVSILADELDADPDVLNCRNGIVHLPTGEIRPHDPAARLSKITDTEYIPGATHPDWNRALTAVDDDVREWLQIRYGQAATGLAPEDDVMPIQVGGGSNGKSTVVEAIFRALGEYAAIVPHRALLAGPNDHPAELMTLFRARFAVMEETPEARHLNATRVKQTLGSRMTARWMRGNPVSWNPTHSLFINTNYKPLISETDDGTWRRMALVLFRKRFRKPGEPLERPGDVPGDPRLREDMKAGRDGRAEAVLAWIVDGARKWYANGQKFPEKPASVESDTLAWRYGSDPMTEFIDEQLTLGDAKSWVSSRDLYKAYDEYLKDHGYKPISEKTFAARFSTHFMIVKVNNDSAETVIRKERVAAATPGRSTVDGILWRGASAKEPEQLMAWTGVRFGRQRPPAEGSTE